MPRYDVFEEAFEEATIFGKPALFTPMRIKRDTIPPGYHYYEIRHDDDCRGDPVQIAKGILVNHWGSLIMQEPIKLPDDGYLDIAPEAINYAVGDCRSMKDFMDKYPPVLP